MSPRRGFTLVEMLVAMSIGSVVVASAVAGLRVALQSMSATTRLSNENALLRAAYHGAHEEVDRWTSWDDPDDPARQGLRPSGRSFIGDGDLSMYRHPLIGLPFTPFSGRSSPIPASGVPRTAQGIAPRPKETLDDATWEDDRGFDASYAWAPHDPRGWFRGNLVERGHFYTPPNTPPPPLGWWGRYALFTNIDAKPTMYVWPVTLPDSTQIQVGYQIPDPVAHRWYSNQIDAFGSALGYYGLVDYLPTNTIYSAYASWDWRENYDGIVNQFVFRYFHSPYNFLTVVDMGKEADLCESAFRATLPSCAIIEQPVWSGTPQPTTDDLLQHHYQQFDTDFTVSNGNYLGAHADSGQGEDHYVKFRERALRPKTVLALEPAAWPHVDYAVGRFIKSNRPVAICRIRWTSALSGELSELSFAGLGTSLRGARQQRRPDRGWASWDDAAGAVCDPTLDSP